MILILPHSGCFAWKHSKLSKVHMRNSCMNFYILELDHMLLRLFRLFANSFCSTLLKTLAQRWNSASCSTDRKKVISNLIKWLPSYRKLQTEFIDIITLCHRYRFVFAADIEKMYCQVRVHQNDWPLQKSLLWRPLQSENPHEYCFCMVTYDLAYAPYLDIFLRYLQQLVTEAENTRAFATKIFRYDIYVDTYVDNILSDTIALATKNAATSRHSHGGL